MERNEVKMTTFLLLVILIVSIGLLLAALADVPCDCGNPHEHYIQEETKDV